MPYTVTPTAIPDVLMLEPKVFGDSPVFIGRELHATVLEMAGESAQS